ncbi:PREDICTED: uncharacterized protein LOC106332744 isoform X1 [Brassica oleracea var. oleracea]|uniref:uncharacterized protein LOC106332744 isoform X1 n=1 Tax=Brassica oleracea var. oleracea TaxID=109376 RepID=UPI0006A7057F|nr:PREDICTED: uncharacterized protein LOC106332744 isoform X1 [Brassica oleracea var. oleracea]
MLQRGGGPSFEILEAKNINKMGQLVSLEMLLIGEQVSSLSMDKPVLAVYLLEEWFHGFFELPQNPTAKIRHRTSTVPPRLSTAASSTFNPSRHFSIQLSHLQCLNSIKTIYLARKVSWISVQA